MRHAPRPATGVLVFALYLAAFYGVWIVTDVDYARVAESADTLWRWYVAPLAAGAVVLVVATSMLGWWRPVLFEAHRLAGPRWLWVGPLAMVIIAVTMASIKDFSGATAAVLLPGVIGSIGVGFCEEVSSRGVLITGFRGRLTEPRVWFLSCLLFGLLHLPNWVFGAGPAAGLQVLLAFGAGSNLYLLRRLSGSLVWAMVLHGSWDFISFIGTGSGGAADFLLFANPVIGIALGIALARRERGVQIELAGAPARAPTGVTAV